MGVAGARRPQWEAWGPERSRAAAATPPSAPFLPGGVLAPAGGLSLRAQRL